MIEYVVAFVAVVLGFVAWLAMSPSPTKIFGIYSQPGRGYYLKVFAFYFLLQIRKLQAGRTGKSEGAGYGVKSRTNIEEMERPQKLSQHPKAIDAVYFNSADEDGNYVVMATARRPKGVINGLLFIRLPDYGVLELPKMPDTILFGNGEKFEAEGLSIAAVDPMKWWKLDYSGPMKLNGVESGRKFDVKLDMNWTSNLDYFDFDTDMHPWALSRSMAREEWSREYFQNLRDAHQTHYEQMGVLRGTVEVDGKTFHLKLDSMRDHSYGHKREWKLMHRYGLHMIHTEDGYSMDVGVICQPVTCSVITRWTRGIALGLGIHRNMDRFPGPSDHVAEYDRLGALFNCISSYTNQPVHIEIKRLELGYLNTPSGEKISVSSVDLPLWQHGEVETPPTDYAFSFVAGDKEYFVEVEILESPTFYIGWEWETRVVERMASFRVNGKRGWGIAEWDYRYRGGRPEEYASKDPEWTKSLNKG